ncbi:MAG: TSUP family transporter [Parcubacteria group bacterium]
MLLTIAYLTLGLFAGTFSGVIGIGGGVIIVPALVLLFGFAEHQAQGTTLALLIPPVGILAAYTYYKSGFINWPVAGLICVGFLIGGLIGAKLAIDLSDGTLQKIFGVAIIIIGIYMVTKR